MSETITPLTAGEVPPILDEQLRRFSQESLHSQPLQTFDARDAIARLSNLEGQRAIGADFGGDKGVTKLFEVVDGELVVATDYEDYVQCNDGDGYLQSLERTAEYASAHDLPVGISWGMPMDGTRPVATGKSSVFMSALAERYGGDFANLLPSLRAIINDAPAGLIAGAIAVNRLTEFDDILLPINGGGINVGILTSDTIYAAEAGHIEAVDELNTYNQSGECGVFGNTYVCLEQLGANKAGIEVQWQARTGEYTRARDIEDRYKQGDAFAGELYDHSAWVMAHMIAGTARVFDIDFQSHRTALICQGGAFNFPSYGERIAQILAQGGEAPTLVLAKDYGPPGSNACLDGAAYAALLAKS